MRYALVTGFVVGWVAAAAPAEAAEATAAVDVQKLAGEVASPDREVCLKAIDRLGALGEKAAPAVPALIEALSRPEDEVRSTPPANSAPSGPRRRQPFRG